MTFININNITRGFTVHVRLCIPKVKGTVPLPRTLFIEHHIDGNTDGLCPLMYSRGKGNYSFHMPVMAIKVY
jgi:hypothetical protein